MYKRCKKKKRRDPKKIDQFLYVTNLRVEVFEGERFKNLFKYYLNIDF
jgi:hypothetical protein